MLPNESPTFKVGALMRVGQSCEQMREELANCDAEGFERARVSYNNTLTQLSSLLDPETNSELSVLCPPLDVGGPGINLSYAALSGWISGLLAANNLSDMITQISALSGGPIGAPSEYESPTGTYL